VPQQKGVKVKSQEEIKGNAKLITHASEMLEVLKYVNKYNWDCNQGRLDDSNVRNMRFSALWDSVQDILEKLGEYEQYPLEEEVA
jgi:hypothetical protein|tara:strand:+ start:3012 stop:3266 length:255 start_codon:yes stop_codon:yes gene_type:complete